MANLVEHLARVQCVVPLCDLHRTAEEEIPRILKVQKSYYAVLKVRRVLQHT